MRGYFLKLSKISLAMSFQPSQNARPPAIESIEINQIRMILVISPAIPILLKTTMSVKNKMMTFAPVAIIFAVFCLVMLRV